LKKNENNNKNIRNSHYKEFSKILKSSDSFTLDLLSKYTESQHNGGTMPMRKKLDKPQDVTVDGNTKFSKNIFFVDSAVLPYLTATPIGYTIMANASRISSKIFLYN
jgi:choline dehydrogenase-like flavoprotein